MTDKQRDACIQKLKDNELSWSEYINSLSPDELEYERHCNRERKKHGIKITKMKSKHI